MVEEFLELDFGDGGVHVSARVEVFRVEAADCPCDAAGGIVHVALCFHRLPAVGAEPVVFHLVWLVETPPFRAGRKQAFLLSCFVRWFLR